MRYLSIIAILFTSCNFNSKIDNSRNFVDCLGKQKSRMSSLNKDLSGEWLWHQDICIFGKPNQYRNKKYRLVFNKDTVTLYSKSKLISQSIWAVKQYQDSLFNIETTSRIDLLGRNIRLCDDFLDFNDMIDEGCSIVFRKK